MYIYIYNGIHARTKTISCTLQQSVFFLLLKNGAISDDGDIENNKTLRRIMAARRGLFLLIASWRQPWDIMGYCAWGCQCCLFHTGHILGHI